MGRCPLRLVAQNVPHFRGLQTILLRLVEVQREHGRAAFSSRNIHAKDARNEVGFHDRARHQLVGDFHAIFRVIIIITHRDADVVGIAFILPLHDFAQLALLRDFQSFVECFFPLLAADLLRVRVEIDENSHSIILLNCSVFGYGQGITGTIR